MLTSDRATGVFAAALTPMDSNLAPDINLMAEHCRWLLLNGCDGLAILGTTGEANSFSVSERINIIEGLVQHGIAGEKLLPGTGSCSVPDAVLLTKVALEVGSKGVLMLPPFYYKSPTDEGLFRHFSEVIQSVSSDKLKIYLYHFPQMSSTPFSYNLIEKLIKNYPDTVVGMKDSSGNLKNMTGAVKNFDNFSVLAGADDLFLKLLEEGGCGCITACANISCSLSAKVFAGFNSKLDIREDNAQLVAVRRTLSQFKLPAGLKSLVSRNTRNNSWLNMRPPLTLQTDLERAEIYEAFDAINYKMPKV